MAGKASSRAAVGGFMTVTGFIMLFYGGWFKVIGILMLIGGLLSIFFAFYRLR